MSIEGRTIHGPPLGKPKRIAVGGNLFAVLKFIAGHPLSRGRRLRSILRFAVWQFRSRLLPGPATFQFVNRTRMYVRRGMTGVTGNLYVGLHEFEDMGFVLHFLRPGDLFVDVGANVGSYSILAAGVIDADVIAFEPGSEALEWLNRNIALNGIGGRIEVRRQAVGGRSGTTLFTKGLDTVNHLVPDGSSSTGVREAVEMITLDEVIENKSAVMLKIDVEGFETEVLRGGAATLASPALRCVLLELNGAGIAYGYNEDDVRTNMERHGFRPFIYDPFARRLTRRESQSTSGNTLFVRDQAYVAERLAGAAAFVVRGKSI